MYFCSCERMCTCARRTYSLTFVCMCVCVREAQGMCVYVCVRVRECVCVRDSRACRRLCVYVCICEKSGRCVYACTCEKSVSVIDSRTRQLLCVCVYV